MLQPHYSDQTVIIEPKKSIWSHDLGEMWSYRELLYFFVWRDIKVRYKQTLMGAGWAIIQPVAMMVVFSVIFGKLAKIPSEGVTYPIFAYAGLLPWLYFSQAVNRSAASLVGHASMVKKIYFPRLLVPGSSVIAPLVDFGVAFLVLLVMMVWFKILPSWSMVLLPGFLLLAMMTALGVGIWLSALNAIYRDVGHAIPLAVQLWMYLTPVVYPLSLVPEKWKLLYSVNPMVGVVEGFRWILVGKEAPSEDIMAMSIVVSGILLISGILLFRRLETTFQDVI